MTASAVITIIVSIGLAGFIAWWFFGKRNVKVLAATQEDDRQVAEIVVEGGYSPEAIELKAGVPAELVFVRKDKSACFDEVVLPDFSQKASLKVDEPHLIKINPQKPGEYTYSCGMRMFFGKIIVK